MRASSSRSTTTKKKKTTAPARRKPASMGESTDKALKQYEIALKAFRKGEYAKAIPVFESIIEGFPTEREICDRARTWLGVARQRSGTEAPRLKSADDYYYQGVLALNEGRLDEATRLFESAISQDAECDKAHYALAAVYAVRSDAAGATRHLARAIEINATNRACALNDGDFDSLREDPDFMALLGKKPEGDR